MTETRTWTRCMLLIPRDFEDTARLKGLLASREWILVEQHDPHLAMAELCIRRRAIASRASWGLPAGEELVLVIGNPSRWECLGELIEAIRRYVPGVELWSFQAGRLVSMSDGRTFEIDPPNQTIATEKADVSNKLDDDGPLGSPARPFTPSRPLKMANSVPDEPEIVVVPRERRDDSEADEESTSISPEEIEMLLAVPRRGKDES